MFENYELNFYGNTSVLYQFVIDFFLKRLNSDKCLEVEKVVLCLKI